MALIVAHLCLNDKLSPPLTGIYAAMPGGVNHETVPEKYKDRFISFEQNANAPVLSLESLKFIWSKFLRGEGTMLRNWLTDKFLCCRE